MSRVRVIGFCDVSDKRRGMDDIVLFGAADRFDADQVPTPEELMCYATERGCYPSGKPGAFRGKCDPIYIYLIGAEAQPDAPRRRRMVGADRMAP